MTEMLTRLEFLVVLGAVDAALVITVVRLVAPRREMLVYGLLLLVTAVAYLLFGLHHGAPAGHLGREALGAGLYGLAAILGVWAWPWLLAVGWAAHGAWDLFFHYANGPAFSPSWYPVLCVGFDVLLGGYIAGAVTRRPEEEGGIT